MNAFRYVLRSVLHYRFAYLGVLAGATLGATVLLGALFAGDSVAASLRRIGEQRIGRATHVLASGDRFFRQALADDLSAAIGGQAAPALIARGTATNTFSQGVAGQVQLVGITPGFWLFAPEATTVPPLSVEKSEVAINSALAGRLGLVVGDTVVVRLQKPGVLAGNAPIAGAEGKLESLRCKVAAVELYMSALPPAKSRKLAPYQPPALLALTRDFAFLADATLPAANLIRAVGGADKALITDVKLFDRFSGNGVADGKVSLAVEVVIQPTDRSLTDADIEALSVKVISAAAKIGAVLRG
ncbi:MAG: hypothetical protein ABIQ12_03000 [Opitutaceae bacterium]